MLEVTLRDVAFRYDRGFSLDRISITFAGGVHTALVGPPACGASTLLRILAGTLRPQSGDVIFGQRRVNELKPSRRPLLHATSTIDVSPRWSVQHALVAAVRTRALDQVDRHREHDLAASKWDLTPLLERRISSLSSTEVARVHLARIELLRPGILLADRLLERVSPAARQRLADMFYRTLRVHGTTAISAPSSRDELVTTDAVVVLGNGTIVQSGSAAELFNRPVDENAALATAETDVLSIVINGTSVDSVIGSWIVDPPPFQGTGVALVRPGDFSVAARGDDSDLIFGVEEAGFSNGRWLARGLLTGGVSLRVELPAAMPVHKGKLLALRYDPARFTLLPRAGDRLRTAVPNDAVPPRSETR